MSFTRTKYFFVFTVIISFLKVQSVFAQSPDKKFQLISYKNGLIQSPITSIIQDKSGYIWIGSWVGLSRYDGNSFINFRKNDSVPYAISHNRINKVYEDRSARLWIGTSGGLNLYNKLTERFQHVGLSTEKGASNFISDIVQDKQQNIWVGTYQGVRRVNVADNKLEEISETKSNNEIETRRGFIFSLFNDSDNKLWVGVRQGVKLIDPVNKKVIALPSVLAADKDLAEAKIIVIRQDAQGTLWFGTEEDGVFSYDKKNARLIHYTAKKNTTENLPSNWINDLLIKNGKVWIATRNGLAIYDPLKQRFETYAHKKGDSQSLNDNFIWSLYNDKTGNVWIGTYSGGINIFHPENDNFRSLGEENADQSGLSSQLAEAMIEDRHQNIWVGTFGGQLTLIDQKNRKVSSYSVNDKSGQRSAYEIKALAEDPAGNIWVGSLDGLHKFNPATKSNEYIPLENVKGTVGGRGVKLVNTIVADQDGLWVGMNGSGLRRVTFDGKEAYKLLHTNKNETELSDNYVNCLLDEGNLLWIGTQNGLNLFNKSTFKVVVFNKRNNRLTNNNVLSIFRDSKKHLWVGTDGGGLNYLDDKSGRFTALGQNEGLPDNVIASVIEDNSGNIWISSNNGLSCLTINNLASPSKRNIKIVNYNSANGLPSNQFLPNSSLKTKNGELVFGGMNGITGLFPNQLLKNTHQPEILLTNLYINTKKIHFAKNLELTEPINETKEIELPYDKNNVKLEFSALNFVNPSQNMYAYAMYGPDNNNNKNQIGNSKEVSFTNLSPGKYILRIWAANNDGIWNTKARSLLITINPPLWRTWWAYLIYVLSIAFIFYKIVTFFQVRARLERDLINEHLQLERQEEFYKMKIDFFTNISHEIRTPLTLILGPVEQLYQSTMDNIVISKQVLQIKNNAERLLRLIGELMDFRKAETNNMVLYIQRSNIVPFITEIFLSFMQLAESKKIEYNLVTDQQEALVFFDRDQLEKVFFNLLSNAFKFTPESGKIELVISSASSDFLTIIVSDNGKGIPQKYLNKLFTNYFQVQPDRTNSGTGVGLALSKKIIDLHHGSIKVDSVPNQADVKGLTKFTVKLPYHDFSSENVFIVDEKLDPEHIAAFKLQSEIDVLPETIATTSVNDYTILLAEDNDELRNFIITSLSQYHITSCSNGVSAFEIASSDIPDLIISDVMMPEMNGLDLCRNLKQDERTSHIPVILLTALAAQLHQINGFHTGAEAYVTKPFSIKILELNIRNLLLSRDKMRKKFSRQILLQPFDMPVHNIQEDFISKLIVIIERKIEDPEFGVDELSYEIGMSRSVLYKKTRSLTDMAPADLIKSVRLKKAALLLQQQKDLTISEVASLVGFNDRKYFSREFKKLHGYSPSAEIK
ncbi:two-component regulator propeller domain-containing protein [Mucilaginibacter terrae]|uniref:hybrid sensor histidine kinase/response regulator transcription factor n=1 Tax=Mucilaginibacter terrae TaxID=1955052 RepID=UPI003641AFAC